MSVYGYEDGSLKTAAKEGKESPDRLASDEAPQTENSRCR